MNSEPLHPFIKGLVAFLLLLIPTLGTLILRTDPVISSDPAAPDSKSIQTVQTFARFIETKPELAKAPEVAKQAPPILAAAAPESNRSHRLEAMTDGQRAVIAQDIEIWQKPDYVRDDQWRAEIDKLFYIAENTGSLDALDLINSQIISARKEGDDVNRSKSDQWLERYLALEHRENKRKEVIDYFREAVQTTARETPIPH